MEIQGDFFGLNIKFPRVMPSRGSESCSSLDDIFLVNLSELRPLADAVTLLAHAHQLDDYATFRLAVFACDIQAKPSRSEPPRTIGASAKRGAWCLQSRMLAIGALLRLMGYGALPQSRGKEILLMVPFEGTPKRYNANIRSTTWTRTVNGVAVSQHPFRWLVWDGQKPLGLANGESADKPLLDTDAIIEGPSRGFDFTQRMFPAFTLKDRTRRELPLFERGGSLTYIARTDTAKFVGYYPTLQFGEQARLASQELKAMALGPNLVELARSTRSEVELINILLRTLQAQFVYREGPLRSLFQIFEDQRGDCDQLSLVMAAMLSILGYTGDDVVAMQWDDHLCLAIKPRSKKPPEDADMYIDVGGKGRFYPLEPTYYFRYNDRIATRWGQVNPQNVRRPFQIVSLHL